MKTNTSAFALASLAIAAAASVASAVPSIASIDGVKTAGEFASPKFSITRDAFLNGTNATDGYVRSTRTVTWDANYVYIAYEAQTTNVPGASLYTQSAAVYNQQDSSAIGSSFGNLVWPGAFDGVNAYLFTSGSNRNKTTTLPGTYGDLDDVLIEGTNQWGFAIPTGFAPGTVQSLVAQGNNQFADLDDGVYVGFISGVGSSYSEAAIARDLVDFDDTDTLRVGGQVFAYGNTFSNVTVPEPVSVTAVAGAALLGLRRRRA